ncbi:unnamed protein product [Pylaiella littoralis]
MFLLLHYSSSHQSKLFPGASTKGVRTKGRTEHVTDTRLLLGLVFCVIAVLLVLLLLVRRLVLLAGRLPSSVRDIRQKAFRTAQWQ